MPWKLAAYYETVADFNSHDWTSVKDAVWTMKGFWEDLILNKNEKVLPSNKACKSRAMAEILPVLRGYPDMHRSGLAIIWMGPPLLKMRTSHSLPQSGGSSR